MIATHDQLQIIHPDGRVERFDLDPARGTTSIGSHPRNDVVLSGSDIRPFHLVLDHRQRPCQVVSLSPDGETLKGRVSLSPNIAHPFTVRDHLMVGGWRLSLWAGGASSFLTAPPRPEASLSTPAGPTSSLAARPTDVVDPVIITEITSRELTVEPGQPALLRLTVLNGGSRAATFSARVDGIDPTWVAITPSEWHLDSGEQRTVAITLLPPRSPESRAGRHHLAVVVTSSLEAGYQSRHGATLVVLPYHDLTLGECCPKELKLPRSRPAGQVTVPLVNRGNSEVAVRLEGADAEGICRFEFMLPAEGARLAREAEVRLGPGESLSVPLRIMPPPASSVGLTKRSYHYTVSAQLLAGPRATRWVLGRVSRSPLIGPVPLLLALVALVLLSRFLLDSALDDAARSAEQMALRAATLEREDVEESVWDRYDITDWKPPVAPTAEPAPSVVAEVVVEPFTAPLAPQAEVRVMTYERMFQEIAPQYGLDWKLLAAIAYQETRYDPWAVGKYGEMGLMQIMPATWDIMAPKVGVTDPWDPYSNTMVSAAFLAAMRDSFQRNGYPEPYWPLIAYCWGPGRIYEVFNSGGGWYQIPEVARNYAMSALETAARPLPPHIAIRAQQPVGMFPEVAGN